MTMHSGKTDFNPTRSPLVQSVKHMDSIKELIRAEKREDFITMLNFPTRDQAIAFCQCLDKCITYNLIDELNYIWNLGLSMVANDGNRAKMFSQTVAGLLVPEFYGGKQVNGKAPRKNTEQPNE